MEMGPGNMAPVRINLHTLVRYWLVSPFTCAVLAGLILAAFWYFQATRDVAEQGRPWPRARTLAFFGGLVVVELAFQSSVAMLPYISFPMQVIQKLFLLVVAPPLLVFGAPLGLALETVTARTADRLLRITGSAPARALTHPVVIFLLYVVGLLGYYLTSVLAASMRHVWLLNLVNLGFLAVALVFWWVALAGEPAARTDSTPRARLALLAAGAAGQLALGVAVLARSRPIAPIYTLAGTHTGGAIVLGVTLVAALAGGLGWVSWWYRGEELPEADVTAEPSATLQVSPPG
jgi:cytochrome c oxidase assembly factor CtaG